MNGNVRGSVVATFTTLVLVAACTGGDAGEMPAFQVRDSAGVEIVENGAPLYGGDDAWRVPGEPVLQIGRVAGEEPYLFGWVADAVRVPDGRIAVADGSAGEIRVFDAEGRHQLTFGRRGDGPEEFGGPPWIALAPPDTLVVWDPGHYRLSRYDLDGNLLDQTSLGSTIEDLSITRFVNGLVWQTAPDGSLLWTGPGPRTAERLTEGLNESTREFVLISRGGEATRDYGDFLSGQTYDVSMGDGTFRGVSNHQFGVRAEGALGPPPDRLTLATGFAWEVRMLGVDGELRRIVRAAIPRDPVTPESLERERERVRDSSQGLGLSLRETEAAFDGLPIPDSVPAIEKLIRDQAGNLWAARRKADGETRDYDVFDPDGRWLMSLRLPAGPRDVFEIGERHVLARWTDENDVQFLRVYRIEKPGG